jgi:hypothetical protein
LKNIFSAPQANKIKASGAFRQVFSGAGAKKNQKFLVFFAWLGFFRFL